jgi:hypothetical protein
MRELGITLIASVVALLAAPPLAGYLIQRSRTRANLAVRVRESHPRQTRPLDELSEEHSLNVYEARVASAYRHASDRIGDALERFARSSGIEVPREVEPLSSVEVALLRMRCGYREGVMAHRSFMTDTEPLGSVLRGLRALLDAEDRAGYRTA